MAAKRSDPETIIETAEKLAALVDATPLGGGQGDDNDRYMAGAVVDAIRRFRWIRRAAQEGAAKETIILTRSLLSMMIRAIYATLPEDPPERRRRYLQLYIRGVDDLEKLSDEGVELGSEPLEIADSVASRDVARAELRQIEGKSEHQRPSQLPSERDLATECGLKPFYGSIYMPMSDVIHFGIAAALAEVQAESVDIDAPDMERSEAALGSAVIVFGALVHASQRSLGHSIGMDAHRIVVEGQLSRGDVTLGG